LTASAVIIAFVRELNRAGFDGHPSECGTQERDDRAPLDLDGDAQDLMRMGNDKG
jgi:hypothetical protein